MSRSRMLMGCHGTVFLTTMVCSLLMATISGYLLNHTSNGAFFAKKLQCSMQAQMLAEAGLMRALSTIQADSSTISSGGNFPETDLGEGTYDASVTTIGARYLVESVGTVKGVSRTVSAEVSIPAAATSALNYAFASGGDMQIDSGTGNSPGSITGDLYAAGNVELDGPSSGGALTITGDVYANGDVQTDASVSVSGSETSQWPTTESFPDVDFDYYQAIAQANSQYFATNKTYASGTIPGSPAGGVIFVDGNITIRGTQNTTACIIATGNITISKSGSTYPRVTVQQYQNFPAIVTESGNITFSSTGNGGAYLITTGLVYAGGNFELSSGNHDILTFTGSVLARGNIEIDPTAWNSLTATYVAQSPPGVTDDDDGGGDGVEIRSYNT